MPSDASVPFKFLKKKVILFQKRRIRYGPYHMVHRKNVRNLRPIVIGPNSIIRSAFNFGKLIMNLKEADKYFLDETLECSI